MKCHFCESEIEVNFKDFRLYEIITKLEYQGVQYESKFEYRYDASLTIDANLSTIVHIIDTQIIVSFYKKGGNNYEEK